MDLPLIDKISPSMRDIAEANEHCLKGYNSEHNKSGECCCNCKWQLPVTAHPWNKDPAFKGSVTEIIGYVCTPPDLAPFATFFEEAHSMCECHQRGE